jgi:hypothetical protein
MTEGNPNIANLGDPNRPTKIAEIYSEIYDNEWTDALDFCQKKLKRDYREEGSPKFAIFGLPSVILLPASLLNLK